MNRLLLGVALTAAMGSSTAAVPQYARSRGAHDGLQLVGMECHHRNKTLEVAMFYARLPERAFDLWNTFDLVKVDQQFNVEDRLTVEKRCTLGDDKFTVRLTGAPARANLQWQCGAIIGAHATITRNGRKVFDEDLGGCTPPYPTSVRLRAGSDAVETTVEKE